jgi:hypothetical protein
MKSYLDEAKQDPKFVEFLNRLRPSANYFVATRTKDEHVEHAILLCIAQTWIESYVTSKESVI